MVHSGTVFTGTMAALSVARAAVAGKLSYRLMKLRLIWMPRQNRMY